ncbi:hypothetical protein DFJ58DRAFT_845704 [Suillus subalutaceus]|uniref:uncharacterized protein n=1 Tax=Suillus subalutaceus TaxID=48586 RepID=UPI001B883A8D|nr:uncharacterized protein DFJ58DRAFT_845704 [Suillus subalutaceus]KAG1839461.1 hypothetical protein DFJ58DRAFT_845704 [Suillus subalutaceus]
MYILGSVPTISTTDAGCPVIFDVYDWTGNVVEVMLGVIMIARLHAMYQRSRKVLIFLVVSFLAITIANAVMIAITTIHISGEVVALCLAVWSAVKHFRELRRHSTSGIIGDCFTVLMKTHIVQTFVLGPRLILGVREYHAELVANSDTATAMTSIAFEERVHVTMQAAAEFLVFIPDFVVVLIYYSTTEVAPVDPFSTLVHPNCSNAQSTSSRTVTRRLGSQADPVLQVPSTAFEIGITRGNGEKCAGTGGPTKLAFVQLVMLME